jgi:phytoene synthase
MARDTNFYYSFLVLTPAKRRAIVAVWDFCRAVDDAVDEMRVDTDAARAEATARLDEWRREIARCFGGTTPATPQGVALQPLVTAFDLPQRPFEDLVDGVAMDIGARRYKTFGELYQYCYRVASTVGLVCVQIFGCQEADSRDYAVDLGVALQLTNILRDVGVDLGRGHLYIPLDELEAAGCTEDLLRTEPRSAPVKALLARQAERAHDFYRRATRTLPRTEARKLIAAEIMSGIYQAILAEIERRDFDVFSEIVRIPRPRRALIAIRTWSRMMFGIRAHLQDAAREVSRRFGGPLN